MTAVRGQTASTRTATEAKHTITVAQCDEGQWTDLHRLCGDLHPGRYKGWVNDGDHGGFLFFPETAAGFRDALLYATGMGLTVTTEVTISTTYEPKETP